MRSLPIWQRVAQRFGRALHVGLTTILRVCWPSPCPICAITSSMRLPACLSRRARGACAGVRRDVLARRSSCTTMKIAPASARRKASNGRESTDQHIDLLPRLVEQCTYATVFDAADDEVAFLERALLHEHGRDRATALVKARFDHDTRGQARFHRGQFHHLGLQQDRVEQVVDAVAGLCRHRHDAHIAAPFLGHDFMLHKSLLDLVRIRLGLVHLVHRHDQRHFRRARMIDRLDRLWHHAVIRGDDQHDDVREFRAARTHRAERGGLGCREADHALVVFT